MNGLFKRKSLELNNRLLYIYVEFQIEIQISTHFSRLNPCIICKMKVWLQINIYNKGFF